MSTRMSRGAKAAATARRNRIAQRREMVRRIQSGGIKAPGPKRVTSRLEPMDPWNVPKKKDVNLGEMGELGDDLVLEVRVNKAAADVFTQKAVPSALYLENIRHALLNQVYKPLKRFMDNYIELYVPHDTGDLQQAMKDAITHKGGSQISRLTKNEPFRVILNTKGIEYAAVVNKMPREWLVHAAVWHRNYSYREGKHELYDPDARKRWYNFVLVNAQNEAERLYKAFINSYLVPIFKKYQALFKNYSNTAHSLLIGQVGRRAPIR